MMSDARGMTTVRTDQELGELRATVRERYGAAAQRVAESAATAGASCCAPAAGSSACCGASTESWDPITANLYDEGEAAGVPAEALLASLGCGNPTALADLVEGEVVLDLGSGGGIDVLLSAKRVGPTGKAYGLDMTDEMLALANENKARAGAANVEFLRGHIEEIPLPSNTVDVIISNCVINLSGDKRQVLAEAFRVLKPGGRFAVSDVVVRGAVPEAVKRNMELWVGCVGGALEEQEFLRLLREVGFEHPSIEPTRVYEAADAAAFLAGSGLDAETFAREIDGKFMGAFVRATKPAVLPLRAARPEDRDAVERLLADAQLPTAGIAELLAQHADDFVVADDPRIAGELAAVAGLEVCGDTALLRSVAVRPEWRAHGLGRELVKRMVGVADARGLQALYLLTTTAEHYFPKFGFERVERSEVPPEIAATLEFRSACPASAIALVMPIAAPGTSPTGT